MPTLLKLKALCITITLCGVLSGIRAQQDTLKIYPNPFSDTAYFELQNIAEDTITLEIYNRWGELIKRFHENAVLSGTQLLVYNGDSLLQGTYFVNYTINGVPKPQHLFKTTPTSLQENSLNAEISVFPNPSSDVLTLKFSQAMASLIVTDVTGKVIIRKNQIPSEIKLDIRHLKDGQYTVQVKDFEGNLGMGRFVKKQH